MIFEKYIKMTAEVKIHCSEDIQNNINKTQYLSIFIVTLTSFSCGAFLTWTSSALPLLTSGEAVLQISETEGSWIASLLGLGAFIGTVSMGLSENFVRKINLLNLMVPMCASYILMLFSTSVYCFYVGRLVGGFSVGALCIAAPSYVSELMHPELGLGNFFQIQILAGALLGFSAGLLENVKWLSVVCGSAPIVYYVSFLFIPDTPIYLMSQGKDTEARNSISFFKGLNHNADTELAKIRIRIQKFIANEGIWKDFIEVSSNFRALIVTVYLMIFLQLTGISPIVFNLMKIVSWIDTDLPPDYCTIIIGSVALLLAWITNRLLKSTKRRSALIYSYCIMALSACCLSVFYHTGVSIELGRFHFVPIVCLSIFIAAFAAGVAPVSFLILDEISPEYLKRKSAIIALSVNWLVSFVVTKYYQSMLEDIGIGWCLWNFGFSCGIGAFIGYFLVPETKGKSAEEIHNELNGGCPQRYKYVIELDSACSTENNSTTS